MNRINPVKMVILTEYGGGVKFIHSFYNGEAMKHFTKICFMRETKLKSKIFKFILMMKGQERGKDEKDKGWSNRLRCNRQNPY